MKQAQSTKKQNSWEWRKRRVHPLKVGWGARAKLPMTCNLGGG